MPEASLIVPVYNAEFTIRRCVDSILDQTFSDFELILINDGSKDLSGKICDEYARKDARIKVIHQINGGVSSARNAGLDAASGKRILFVDSDDYIDRMYVEKLCSSQRDLAICGMETHDSEGTVLLVRSPSHSIYSYKHQINYTQLYQEYLLFSPYCKSFRNDIISKYHIRFPVKISWGEDGMFVSDYLYYVNSMEVMNYAGYYYIQYNGEYSLATKVRFDIVDTIVYSREYCIAKMLQTNPSEYDAVKKFCERDIRSNCAYFVRRLLCNFLISRDEKVSILRKFMANSYVRATFSLAHEYYPNDRESIRQSTPEKIIRVYNRLHWRERLVTIIYIKWYEKQPEFVKKIYREIKKWVRK